MSSAQPQGEANHQEELQQRQPQPQPLTATTAAPAKTPKPPKPLPINWPPTIPYLHRLLPSPQTPPRALQHLNQPTRLTSSFPKYQLSQFSFPCPNVQIHSITGPETHPALGQHGLFATRQLGPGTLILPYLGLLHLNLARETDAGSDYDIVLTRTSLADDTGGDGDGGGGAEGGETGPGFSIDAGSAHGGTEARFVNDYRGVDKKPNAEFRDMWVRVGERKWERWIGVFVLNAGKAGLRKKGIARGQEILVSYGKGFWAGRTEDGDEEEEIDYVQAED